eukprot:5162671-Pleurochrysis_carterae.AAC.1
MPSRPARSSCSRRRGSLRGCELPPFVVDSESAVDFLKAVLDSPVRRVSNTTFRSRESCGTGIKHDFSVVSEAQQSSEAVALVQVYKLALYNQQVDSANSRASMRTNMPAIYIELASLHHSQRVPHPSDSTLKGLPDALTRKGKVGRMGTGGKRAVGLLEDLRFCFNQRRSDPELKDLSAADAELRLLLRWDSMIPFSKTIFEAPNEPPLAVASAESCPTTARASSVQQGESGRPISGKDTLPSDGGSRNQPLINN